MNLKAQFFYFLLHLEKEKPNKCPIPAMLVQVFPAIQK